jgi:phage terminase large subunit-like protein
MFGITTAGYDRHTVCWEKHEYSVRVLERVVDDDGFFGFLTTIDEGDDWRAEATWQKAMPNLGTTVELSYMRQQASEAQRMPAKENAFKRLLLNVWTEQESRWLQMEAWDAASCDAAGELVPVAEEDLELRPCFAALDLSSTRDVTALVLVFPETDGTYRVVPRFWLPEEAMSQRAERDGVPYDVWVRQGLVRTTPGNVIDYGYVRECILEDARRFSLREVAFDPYNAQKLVTELQAEGLEMVEFRQGFLSMGPALTVLEVAVLKRRLRHGANPVLRWMASNLVVEQDPAGNLKPSKRRSKEKIDGMVALTMALARADAHAGETPEEPSIYVLGEDGETE